MQTLKKVLVTALIIMSFSAIVAGCNTMSGVGKDFAVGGKKLSEVAEK